jgi:hypothetical protein
MAQNLTTTSNSLTDLSARIGAAKTKVAASREAWITGSLDLIAALADARAQFAADRDFSHWLVHEGHDDIGKNDRAALIAMAACMDLTRAALAETERHSYRLIWKKEIRPRLPKDGKPATATRPEADETGARTGTKQRKHKPLPTDPRVTAIAVGALAAAQVNTQKTAVRQQADSRTTLSDGNRVGPQESAERMKDEAADADAEADQYEDRANDTDAPEADDDGRERSWQRSLGNFAGEALTMPAFWTREFGPQWKDLRATSDLIVLAQQAADTWREIATHLTGPVDERATEGARSSSVVALVAAWWSASPEERQRFLDHIGARLDGIPAFLDRRPAPVTDITPFAGKSSS